MKIYINETENIFHLQNSKISYIMKVLKDGSLGTLHYGKAIKNENDFNMILDFPWRGNLTNPIDNDEEFTLENAKLEYSTFGFSDFDKPAIEITKNNEQLILKFDYVNCEIMDYQQQNFDLPHFRDVESKTLKIKLHDKINFIDIDLFYTIIDEHPAIIKSYTITNNSKDEVFLNTALSGNFDLKNNDYEVLSLHGAWIRERKPIFQKISNGNFSISSRRGSSSHHQNPFIAIGENKLSENHGDVYTFGMVYSGNFLIEINNNTFDRSRVRLGINPDGFNYLLEEGQSFNTPQCISSFSSNGLTEMTYDLHEIITNKLVNKSFLKERPILINNWEATYFDFDEQKLHNLVDKASEIGVEMFVLDDGWFGRRNDDTTSLGDWVVDYKKLPNGLEALNKYVNSKNMKFGIWIEPEMVSPESDLYKQKPDWFIGNNKHKVTLARNQLVLDFTNDEVVDYIFTMLKDAFKDLKLDYIKWDFNRYITEATSSSIKNQGNLYHDYVKGVYKLYELLTNEFKDTLIEGCASGGGRFDLGMLYYSPQIWASDNTDPICRLEIQEGTTYFYPQSTMGAHVGSAPGHQVGRENPTWTRFAVAMFGAFGYEIDLTKLDEKTLASFEEQISFYKKHRETLLYGKFTRLYNDGNTIAWQVESEKEVVIAIIQIIALPNSNNKYLKLKNIENGQYKIQGESSSFSKDYLENIGININNKFVHNIPDEERKEFYYQRDNLGQIDFSNKIIVLEKVWK